MTEDFGLKIDDGSSMLPKFVVDTNRKYVELYNWQREAIDFFFKHNCKTIFEVTTGAGKSLMAIELLKEIWKKDPDCRVLIVVPKNVILETTWYKELYDCGVSLRDIGVYYGRIKEYAKVTLTNMQNIDNVATEIFDCVIFDEIHNYGTKRLLPYVDGDYKYKIGLSATLERSDAKHWAIMELFDYNVFKYTPEEALADGILNVFNFCDMRVVFDSETRDEYEKITQEINTLIQAGGGFRKVMMSTSGLKYRMLSAMTKRKKLMNNYKTKFSIVRELCRHHRDDKIIVFNQFNAQTNKSYWQLLDSGVRAKVIHSGLSADKRDQILIDYRRDVFSVLLTTKILDEGYNLPKLDVAIIAAGDSTAKQTIQRLGRVLRKKQTPSYLYQIYCEDTVEQEYATKRAKLFKLLCNDYEEHRFVRDVDEGDLRIWKQKTRK